MDDVFQILIYILILVSFLSSIFKKKKTVDQKKQQAIQNQQRNHELINEENETKAKQGNDADLIKEFEKFFQIDQPKSAETETLEEEKIVVPKQKSRIEGRSKKTIDDEGLHQPTESEHTFTNLWEKKSAETKLKTARIDKTIEKQAAMFEKQLLAKSESATASQISRSIRKRLQNPSSLKEYVIISEIMGTPKSLQ